MKKARKSKFLPIALLGLSLLGGKISAQENYQEAPTEIDFAQENLMKEIDLKLDYELGTKTEGINYSLETCFDDPAYIDFFSEGSLIDKIETYSINSYQSLLENSKSLTEHQKLVFLSICASQGNNYGYDLDSTYIPVISQENFFDFLQGSFLGIKSPIGVCRQIASNVEKLANDMGLRAAAVTAINGDVGHAVDVIKTSEGTSIIDYSDIFSFNTKNIENVLEAYQKGRNSLIFQHVFFEDNQFKYKFITKDGKNFLDFVDYDPSLNEIKDSLINKNNSIPYLTLTGEKKDNLFSAGIDFVGPYFKGGMLTEDLSPENKMGLFQAGFKRKFFPFGIMSISPDMSLILGKKDGSTLDDYLWGFTGNVIISTEKKEGLNLSSRFSTAVSDRKDSTLFYNVALDAGISYSLKVNDIKFEPYVLSQLSFLKEDMGTCEVKPIFNELEVGLRTSFQTDDLNLSIEPHYNKRIWEDEFGADAKLEIKNFNFNLGGDVTKSGYYFCPDKFGLNAGVEVSLKTMTLKLGYKVDETNYEGEKEANQSFSLTGKIRLGKDLH